MKCQNCGAEIPDGKIYCEKCGTAIQMVPDYNPVEDISIGMEEKEEKENLKTDGQDKPEKSSSHGWWRFVLAGVCLAVFGYVVFQASYQYTVEPEETIVEPEVPELLSKPEFSIAPGTYNYSPRLTISHDQREEGLIYYTTDGTTPDADSNIYNAPIVLGEGKTVIRAVFIRSDGIQSEEANGTYEIEFYYPAEPVISVPGGDYPEEFYVTISTEEENARIYYTTNGEEPDVLSQMYQGPILISPGLTVLQAVTIGEDGNESGIVEEIYNVMENPENPEFPEEGVPLPEEIIP